MMMNLSAAFWALLTVSLSEIQSEISVSDIDTYSETSTNEDYDLAVRLMKDLVESEGSSFEPVVHRWNLHSEKMYSSFGKAPRRELSSLN